MGAEAHVWITHPGEFALFGQARPSYWAGSGTLPRANQYKGFASAIWDVSDKHPVDFTHAYFPVFAFKETRIENGWAFAENDKGGLLAITAANGIELTEGGPNANRELISQGKRNIWIIRCSDTWKEGSLDEFVKKIISTPLSFDMETLGYRFSDKDYGEIKASWSESLSVNNRKEVYKGFTPYGDVVIENA